MSNILFNDLPKEKFFDGSLKYNPVKITVTDVFLLSENEINELADIMLQLHKVGCESKEKKIITEGAKLMYFPKKEQCKKDHLEADHSHTISH